MVLLAPADEQIRLSLASDKKSILFSVSGVAPSLSEEDLPLIFERFLVRQTCGSTDSLPERSGAGLAFARRVIHLHGGFIEAKGGSGSSVTFFARLPRGASAE
jgi:signal transduction histidine kinase